VLYVGQCYYNTWYLSRALRNLGWQADVLEWGGLDPYLYHGHDFRFEHDGTVGNLRRQLSFWFHALRNYDIFHFSGAEAMRFSNETHDFFARWLWEGAEIGILKRFGRKVVYSGNGCRDAVLQSSYAKWGDTPICSDCPWRDVPTICSDERNTAWGEFRNKYADFQVLMGSNRVDWNADPRCHEVPEYYCLDPDFWYPELLVPTNMRLPIPEETVKIYHAVGGFDARSIGPEARTIKSTHIYLPLIEQLKSEGYPVELIFFKDVPNTDLRYYQAQADIVVDMLTVGWIGANVREAMMMGKPVVCYLRPEWLEDMRREIPGYIDELPVVSATPETVREVLIDLINNPEKRREIGRKSREFAVRWHSADTAARRFDTIYKGLLAGEPGTQDFRDATHGVTPDPAPISA